MSEFTMKDYKRETRVTWCPGCGDYGILTAIYQAFAEMNFDPENTVVVSGIGCSSRAPYFINTYGMHTLHGRALPVATGLKLARQDLNVIVVGGDGDAYSIGGNHFLHACRKNVNITYFVMNNSIYGLTKGQASPTSGIGFHTNTTPYGTVEKPMNPVALAMTCGASFVARAYAGKIKQLKEVMVQALKHEGFSFVDIISPCVTFNKVNTFKTYKDLIVDLPSEHSTSNKLKALTYAMETAPLYSGIFYEESGSSADQELFRQAKKFAVAGSDLDVANKIIRSYL